MAEGCATSCAKFILIGFNILFMLFGLALVIIGAVFLANVDFLTEKITPVFEKIEFSGIAMDTLVQNLSIVFLVLGSIVLLIAISGLIGACCEVQFCLVLYAIILIVLFIAQLVVVILWAVLKMQVEDKLRSELEEQLKSHYKSDTLDHKNQLSNALNYIFITMDCCGVSAQKTRYDFGETVWYKNSNRTGNPLPRTCCKDATGSNYKTKSCTIATGNYNDKGCMNEIKQVIDKYSPYFIAFGVLVLVLEIVCAICAILVCRRKSSEKIA